MQSRDVATPIGLLSYASLYVYKALVTATVYAIIKLIEQTLLTGYEPFDAVMLRNYSTTLHLLHYSQCSALAFYEPSILLLLPQLDLCFQGERTNLDIKAKSLASCFMLVTAYSRIARIQKS